MRLPVLALTVLNYCIFAGRWLIGIGEASYPAVVQAHEGDGPYWDNTDSSLNNWAVVTDVPTVHLSGWYGTCGLLLSPPPLFGR